MDPSEQDELRIAVAPPTLRELAVARLRAAIIDGRFRPGDRLVERVLCAQLGVSRSVVREAVRFLEAEGLVEVAPRVGPVVAKLTQNQAQQIYAIRLLLEAAAAAEAARRLTPQAAVELRTALAALQGAAERQVGEQGSGPDLLQATTAFYRVIFAIAGQDVAWEVVSRLNSRISRLRALTLASATRRVSGPARLVRIAEAILAQDPNAAAAAVREHLAEAAEIAHQLLEGV